MRSYGAVGASIVLEALGRLVLGLVLVLAGAGVTGAYLGTPLSMVVAAAVLIVLLRRRTGSPAVAAEPRTLRSLVSGSWAPVVGLVLLAALQNVDVIVANREMTDEAAGAYAAAVVAAKLMVWVAIGVGIYLLPEAARRAAAGLDPRPVFLRTLWVLGLVSVPALLIFAVAPVLLLRTAFGDEFTSASGVLLMLGAAMTFLAVAYLAVQYMLALRRTAFLWLLGVVAVAEPFLLTVGDLDLEAFAAVVLGLQCVAAVGALGLALGRRAPVPA
jgi:O-antigen/teichoic acid export membrane protein